MDEKQVNNLFIQSTCDRKKVHRALGKETAGKQISYDALYSYWSAPMTSQWGVDVDPPQFSENNVAPQDLWGPAL